MPRAIDKVTVSFGLVSIPARIYSTGEPGSDVSFHLVHEKCGTRVKQQWYCPHDDEVVERSELVKGYEVSKHEMVTFTPAELKQLDAAASQTIALDEFVPIAAVDPIYFERHYYLGPDRGGEHAYELLRAAMAKSGLCGIATYAARGKQYVVVLRPEGPGLVVHQLRYPDEVRGWDELELPKPHKPKPSELHLAEQIIAQITHDEVDLARYHDEVKERVKDAIAEKAKGHAIEIPEAATPRPTKVVDLLETLRASLASGARAQRVTRARPQRAARRAARSHPRRRRHA